MGRSPSTRNAPRPARYGDDGNQPAAAALLALAGRPIVGHRQARRAARGAVVAARVAARPVTAPINTAAGLNANFKPLRDLIAAWPAEILALQATADAKPPSITIGGVAWFKTGERLNGGVLHVTKDGTKVCSIKGRKIAQTYNVGQNTTAQGRTCNVMSTTVRGRKIKHQMSRLVMRAFHGAPPAGHVVDHINLDSRCDHVHNLRYLSHAHNLINSTKL